MANDDQNKTVEFLSPESWEYSRNYAALLGEIPNSFGSTVRSLMSDFEKKGGALSPSTKFLAARLVRSQSLKASFYYAAQTYKPEIFEGKNSITDADLVQAFSADELAALLGIIYLYKKAKKLCDPTELGFILPALLKEIDVAGHVGNSMPAIGLASGLLSFGMRHIATLTFLKHNTKHFQEFRRVLKGEKNLFNLKLEAEYFGCTVPQIGSIFLQTLGFGINFSNSYAMAFSNSDLLTKTEIDSSPFKVTELWTRSLVDSGKMPEIIHESKFYPKTGDISKKLVARCTSAPIGWLEKNFEDISPEKTPLLFAGQKVTTKETEPVPEEISAEVASEDIDKLDI